MRPFLFLALLLAACIPSATAADDRPVVLEVDYTPDNTACGTEACCPEGFVPVGFHAGAVVCLGN